MKTFHIPAHAGSDRNQDYCWDYSGQWGRTVDAIERRSVTGRAVFSETGDEYVPHLGCVVQDMTDEQYESLPARLRRRLDAVMA